VKRILLVLIIGVISVFIGGNAMADPIPLPGGLAVDFRTDEWAGALGKGTWEVNGVKAWAYNGTSPSTLYQDSDDGLGIQPGENDEIDHVERLYITFENIGMWGMWLTGVWITDLFNDTHNGSSVIDANEAGQVKLNYLGNESITIQFYGINSDQANGEQFVSFGGPIFVTNAYFEIYGSDNNNEFSVAGFTAAVPEPGILILLGLSMMSIAGLRRWWK